jgi:hypothetical protein
LNKNYNFRIFGTDCYRINEISGTFKARTPFYLTINGFKENNDTKYINNFAYVTAEFKTRQINSVLEPFFAPITPQQIYGNPAFWSKYNDGSATIKLWENSTYALRLIDGLVEFEDAFAIPNITKSYGTNAYLGLVSLYQNTTLNVLLTEKDLRPYTWLMNIILLIVSFLAMLTISHPSPPDIIGLVVQRQLVSKA